jgi:hypothetical protein
MLRRVAFLRTYARFVFRLIVAAKVVPSSPIYVTLITETIRSSEMLAPTTATRRNISEGGIRHSHRREYHKSCIALSG